MCVCVCVGMDLDCVWLEKRTVYMSRGVLLTLKLKINYKPSLVETRSTLQCRLVVRHGCSGSSRTSPGRVFSFSDNCCLSVRTLGKCLVMSSMSLNTSQRVRALFVSLICYVYVSQSHAQKPDTAECKMKMYDMMTSSWFPGVWWEKSQSFKPPRTGCFSP